MNTDYQLTEAIIGAAYEVHNSLGFGFLEAVYQRALKVELDASGVYCELELPLQVLYRNLIVGEYRADLVVESRVIVEIKALSIVNPIHEQQLVHYLRATNMQLGLLINFGKSVSVKRKINSKSAAICVKSA